MSRIADSANVRQVTDDEIATYQENGWVKLDSLITRDLATRMLEVARTALGESHSTESQKSPEDYGWWRDYHFIARDDRAEPFYALTFSQAMGSNIQRLLGRSVSIKYFTDMVACKMPAGHSSGSSATLWHQDLPHLPHDRVGHVSVWIAMDEVTVERGGLQFISGSHREGPLGRVFGVNEPDILARSGDLLGKYEKSPALHFAPGDATCHGALTVHGASENMTDRPRWAYISTYFPSDVLYTGLRHNDCNGLGLRVDQPFDHPKFPTVI